jgi:hypothetical protein
LRKVHKYLGVLLLSLPSCSAADTAGGNPTPTSNDALLALAIPSLVEVWALEHYSFCLFSLLPFGLANMFFCHRWVKVFMTFFWQRYRLLLFDLLCFRLTLASTHIMMPFSHFLPSSGTVFLPSCGTDFKVYFWARLHLLYYR